MPPEGVRGSDGANRLEPLVPAAGERGDSDIVAQSVRSLHTAELNPRHSIRLAVPWPTLEPLALHGLTGDFLRAVGPHTEADEAAMLGTFLATFGIAAGRDSFFEIGRDEHHLRLFVLVVGKSAKSRKGTSWREVRRAFAEADPDFIANNLLSGLSTGEGLIREVRDPGADGSFGVSDKRRLAIENEFARVLSVGRRDGNALWPTLRTAWDGDDLRTLTRGDPLRASKPHVGLVSHGTLGELHGLLFAKHRAEIYGGSLNRFLILCARASKELAIPTEVPPDEWYGLVTRLRETLAWVRARALRLEFDAGGEKRWREIYHDLRHERGGFVDEVTNRAEAQTRRIAATFAALDRSVHVRREHVEAAFALWRYGEASARVLVQGDPDARSETEAELQQRTLVDWIAPQPGRRTTARNLARKGPTMFRPAGNAEAALGALARDGLGRWVDIPTSERGGTPTRALELLPGGDC